MKKIIFIASIILLILFNFPQKTMYAADSSDDNISPMLSPVITLENKEIQYDLPYPGLLPDNPLYFLKVVRDKIEEFLISDPAKKADFDMQLADKEMSTSIYVSNDHPAKEDLISSSVSQALNYFDKSIMTIQQARSQGQDVKDFIHHLDTASQKYRQVIMQLQTKASSSLKANLSSEQTRLAAIRSKVTEMEKSK